MRLVLSCEHGGNHIPDAYQHLFREAGPALKSHRGYDPGAIGIFHFLKKHLPCEAISSEVSRLLVELNRSIHHPRLWSEFTRNCTRQQKEEILRQWYHPYRDECRKLVESGIEEAGVVLHIAVHSFTPVLDGQVRHADVGLLYDPGRPLEKALCRRWQQLLDSADPALRVRLNYPYLGKSDGLPTGFRRHFPVDQYIAVELEMNQDLLARRPEAENLARNLTESVRTLIS